jgi:hypothetical protein
MSRQLHLRALAFLQAMLLLAMLVLPALAAATEITTDLWVYADGDTVNVSGIDFGPSEVVDFVTTDPDGTVVDSGTSTSDEAGNVAYSFVLNVTVGGLYTVVGTGESSGLTASVQFDPLSISSVDNASTVEGSASHVQNVTIKIGGSGSAITVFWRTQAPANATAGASCAAGVDFVTTSGSTSASADFTVPVTICGDSTGELDETFTVQASQNSLFPTSPGNATKTGTVTIVNDDTSISIGDVSQNEGNSGTSTFAFQVSVSPAVPAGGQVNLTWLTSDITAGDGNCVAHKDYNNANGSLSFAPGESSKTINVTVCGDTIVEVDETFAVDLTLLGTTNYTVTLLDGHAVGTIVNDDFPPTNTAPTVTVGGVSDGATYAKGLVPAATCNVVDAEDGNSSFAATLSSITGPYASDGIGSQTASCAFTDSGGLSAAPASATYSIVDPSAPSITYVLTPVTPDGSHGWYKSTVTLTWTVSDADSPNSLAKTGCVDQNITTDMVETTFSCSATSAGGSSGPVDVTFKVDVTAPTSVVTTLDRGTDHNGWYNQAVGWATTGSDATSLIDSCDTGTYAAPDTLSTTVSGACTDNAGNTSAPAASAPFMYDATAPTIVITTPPDGYVYLLGQGVQADFACADATSDVASCVGTVADGANISTSPVGPKAFTVNAADNAGNPATLTHNYSVIYNWTGFFQPVENLPTWNLAKAGQSIPVKFSLGGNQGLNILSSGYPKVTQIQCPAGNVPADPIENYATSTANNGLVYDATANQYNYVWKTEKGWAGKCFIFQLGLNDGTTHNFYVEFTR